MDSIKGVMFGKRPSYLPTDAVSSTTNYSTSSSSSFSFGSEEDSTYPQKYKKKQKKSLWNNIFGGKSNPNRDYSYSNQSSSSTSSSSSFSRKWDTNHKYGGYYVNNLNGSFNTKKEKGLWGKLLSFSSAFDPREFGLYSIVSFFFLLMALLLVYSGVSICRSSAYNMKLSCSTQSCEFIKYQYPGDSLSSSTSAGLLDPLYQITFPRSFLLKSSPVRIRNGLVVQADKYRGKKARTLGHSYVIKIKTLNKEKNSSNNVNGNGSNDGWTEEEILIADFNIGRKKARKQAAKITSYIRGEMPQVDVVESRGWSASGIALVIFGSLGVIFVLILGDFTGKRDKKLRKQG